MLPSLLRGMKSRNPSLAWNVIDSLLCTQQSRPFNGAKKSSILLETLTSMRSLVRFLMRVSQLMLKRTSSKMMNWEKGYAWN